LFKKHKTPSPLLDNSWRTPIPSLSTSIFKVGLTIGTVKNQYKGILILALFFKRILCLPRTSKVFNLF
jgi:hypothetical protein